jgi:serine/threonine protein kinase
MNLIIHPKIVRCRIATLWECVHRPTGRRYCAKAIDKRRFASPADRAMAVREITMHRSIIDQQFSPTCHLPRIRDIFADEEAAEPTPTQQHDECKSSASCCSGSTMSISSHSHSACDDSNNHNNNFWYIVQDFEAGGENLRLYLLGRENSIFNVPEKGGDDYGGNEMSSNELHALAEASRAASNIMQESEVRSLARSLLLAVKGLHDRSICHNDLCPENVLVLFSATTNHHNDNDCWEALKLCDLGRSFFVDDTAINDTTNGDGSTVGDIPQHSSIYYTSPEVLLGKPPGLASDMWSVGVILYRCFAGELPFQEQREDNTRLAYSCSASVSSSSTKGSIAKMLRQQLKREICQADCKFMRSRRRKTDRRWSRVSRGAKQFLSTLLNRDPSVRMTCGEALKHPWLQMNGIITAPSSPPNRSCSMISSSLPIVPSLTSTNHYHHHPQYSTTGVTKMNEGDYSHHHQEEDAGELDISPTISSSAESAGGSQSTDDSSRSVQTRLKSFVHKCFGRLKSSNNNHNRVSADAQFVID